MRAVCFKISLCVSLSTMLCIVGGGGIVQQSYYALMVVLYISDVW
jgi:hypothetical protein